jgi:hypothetical protein
VRERRLKQEKKSQKIAKAAASISVLHAQQRAQEATGSAFLNIS